MSRRGRETASSHGPRRRAGLRRRLSVGRAGLWRAGWVALVLWQTPLPVFAVVDVPPPLAEFWRRLGSVGGRGQQPVALAQNGNGNGNGNVAVGDLAGVSWWHDEVRARAVLPLVRDLAFDSDGVLWIATLGGLYSWHFADRPVRRRLPGGEASNRIHRIAVSNSALLLATGTGAFWSSDGKIFQPLRVSGVATMISHVAIRAASFDRSAKQAAHPHPGRAQAWFFGAGRLSRVRGLEASSGMRVTDLKSLPLPRPGSAEKPVDLVIDPSGRRLFFVFEDAIAWRSIEGDEAGRSTSIGWQFERPGLPPGAVIRRLGWAAGRIWLATDHGLLVGETLKGPFLRTASPVGTTDCIDVQPGTRGRVLALCRAGLFALDPLGRDTPGAPTTLLPARPSALPPDPPLAEIRRRALMRSGLTARRAHGMWERLRRRAFWPELALRFDVDFDFDRQRDDDQAFISGDTRRLFDRTRDEGRRYRGTIELDWDLGGVVYPLESVDLSRELRQVVSLRDDVADEINQLYFERQAIRAKLSQRPPTGSIEADEISRLQWRARELDAGLDAWTGGWISRWRALQPIFPDPEIQSDHPVIMMNK